MKLNKLLLALLFGATHFAAFAQNNILYGLLRTPGVGINTAAGTVRLGTLDVSTGAYAAVSPASLSSMYNATGAALDPYTQTYFFQTQNQFMAVNMLDGLPSAQNALSNPIAPSYFDNYRFNASDSTIYGLARRSTTVGLGQVNGELYLATIEPNTGVITQLSAQSVGEMYAVQGSAVNPHEMVYYYSSQGKIIGLDLYNGQVYSNQTITFPQGGLYFDNYTYNCADTTIYGIIRKTTTLPNEFYLGKINPQTGVVTQISAQQLPFNTYTLNGSSTIDPVNGIYYFVAFLPQGGNAVVGVSVATGTVLSQTPIPSLNGTTQFFDLMRHPSDCYEATPTRFNPNGGSVGFATAEKSELKVAPNPFDQFLSISSEAMIQTLTLRDAQGKVVLQQKSNSNKLEVETASLQSGVYFLEVLTTNGIELVKVVK